MFHPAHRPASVNTRCRGTVLGSETFLGAEENSADVQSWQKSVILSYEGSHLCHSVMALEVCTVKNEKGKLRNYPCEIFADCALPFAPDFS